MNKPLFITLEGGEGVGKSTNMAFIAEFLQSQKIPFIQTREPGGTELAEKIRDLLLTKTNVEQWSEMAELLLVFAARAQHLSEVILPSLEAGKTVLCDRFTDATYAYQGGGRGLNNDIIAKLEALVQGDLRPDLTLLLDAPLEVGMARAQARAELDRFESEKQEFFERVRSAYLMQAKKSPQQFAIINSALPLLDVQSQIKQTLLQYLGSSC